MNSALDDIAFLANSANRVAILLELADGPHSKHVLMESTDFSRVTLGRILDDLEDRQWITQRGQVCDITPLGAWVIEEFGAFQEMMEAERTLRDVFQWFPADGYGFHISCLADADITSISRADASAPISTLIKQFDLGGRIYCFSFAITSQFLEACWRSVMDGHVTVEWVFTSDVLEVLRSSPAMARQSREMLESDRATYRHYEGDIPYVVIVSEETVNLRLADRDGAATALIQTDNEQVRSWAETQFDEYWAAGAPLDAEAFTP